MFLDSVLNSGSTPVLEQVLQFTQARHQVLANNVSNFDTVGYKMKDLPASEFFDALNSAVEKRSRRGAGASLDLHSTKNLSWDRRGRLQTNAIEIENNNILFHDGNNRFVEKQMVAMSKNALLHNVTSEMLRGKYNGLQMAIRGRL